MSALVMNANLIASGDILGHVHLHNTYDDTCMLSLHLDKPITSLALSRDGDYLVVGTTSNVVVS